MLNKMGSRFSLGKKNYLQILFAILVLTGLQINTVLADNRIKMHLHQPAPNQLGINDLWQLDIENTTNENLVIYLEGTVSESKGGLIVEGQSKPFEIKPGNTSYGYNDFKNGLVIWKNKKYQEAIVRTGNSPTGIYTICVTAKLENGEIAGQENCIEQNIEIKNNTRIDLIEPVDNYEFLVDGVDVIVVWPKFVWSDLNMNGPYTLIITKINRGQSAEESIQNNKAIFIQKEIKNTTLKYPLTAPKLEKGKKYAWKISSGDVKSEIFSFSITKDEQLINTDTIENANEQLLIVLVSPTVFLKAEDTRPIFKWTVNKPDPDLTYSIKVVELNINQGPEDAIITNTPLFEQNGIKKTSLEYPASLHPLDTAKFYIWTVTAWDHSGRKIGQSMIGGFKLPLVPPPACNFAFNPVAPINACLGGVASFSFTANISGYLYVLVDPNGVQVTSILSTNGTGQTINFTPTLPGTYMLYGIQFFTLPYPCHWLDCIGICIASTPIILPFTGLPKPIVTGPNLLPCNNSVQLSITNFVSGYIYQWFRCNSTNPFGSPSTISSFSPNISFPGGYRVRVTDPITGACSFSDCWTITDPTPVPVITGAHNICKTNGQITLSSNSTSTLQWYKSPNLVSIGAGSSINITDPGTYYVTSTIGGCVTQSANWIVTGYPCGCNQCNLTISIQTIIRDQVNLQKYTVTVNINNLSDCPGNINLLMLSGWGGGSLTTPNTTHFTPTGNSSITFYFISNILNPNQVRVDFVYTELSGFSCKKTLMITIPV